MKFTRTPMFVLCGCLALFVCTSMLMAQAGGNTAAIKAKLEKMDSDWSAAASARNVDKVMSYYAADAVVQAGNEPSLTGTEAIKKAWVGMLGPDTKLSWKQTKTEVAKSGDMAYQIGTYEMSMKDAKGKMVNDKGKFLAIWKKQADGSWKCAVDSFSSDMAAPQ